MRALLVHNPSAGRPARRRELPAALAALRSGGWTVDPGPVRDAQEGYDLIRQCGARGYDVALVAGGDGTVNLAVNALMAAQEAGEPVAALAVLPAGTANVLASDLGLAPLPGVSWRNALMTAARRLLAAKPCLLDVGLATSSAGQRYFICWAGIGLDAAISAAVESQPDLKRRFGPVMFAVNALRELSRSDVLTQYTVRVDGEVWQSDAVLAVISNIRRYALVLTMAPRATLNDGLLDCVLFKGPPPSLAVPAVRLLVGAEEAGREVRYARAQQIVVDTAEPRPVHLDAEPFGVTPLTVDAVPRALPVLVPPGVTSVRPD